MVHRAPLFGLKHSGIGARNVVGLDGHVDLGESAQEAAVREAFEEAGIVLSLDALAKAGEGRFRSPGMPGWDQDVAVFTTTTWAGVCLGQPHGQSRDVRPLWCRKEAGCPPGAAYTW